MKFALVYRKPPAGTFALGIVVERGERKLALLLALVAWQFGMSLAWPQATG